MTSNEMQGNGSNYLYQSGNEMRHRGEGATSTSAAVVNAPTASNFRHEAVRTGKRPRGINQGKGKGRARGWGIGREGWVEDGFRRFGEHCARNQIRTLLIDCLVMTNLFYPSLAIYLQKQFPPLHPHSPPSHNIHKIHPHGPGHAAPYERSSQKEHPLQLLSTPILDSFFPYPPPLLPRLNWAGWWGRDTGQLQQWGQAQPDNDGASWSAVRPKDGTEWLEDEIQLVRVGWADVGDVLDGMQEEKKWVERDVRALRFLEEVADRWENETDAGMARCVRMNPAKGSRDRQRAEDSLEQKTAGRCLVLSPEPIEAEDLTPISIFATNVSNTSRFLSPHPEPYHQILIPFHVSRGAVTNFEDRLSDVMDELALELGGEVFVEAKGPSRNRDHTGDWLLRYISNAKDSASGSTSHVTGMDPSLSSRPPNIVYLFYLVLFSVLGHQLSNASKVHSRFGLAFTGCVQLCCSTIMSFSVLALFGWNGWGFSLRPPTLPTYILPFVIVIVGAENMSTLTKAVFSVPFTYSVPDRIGIALGKVGKKIAITSLSDVILLGIVWFLVNITPVREFCVFAIVVIITDWFMIHTFFLTILSIDAQRLELEDVLASTPDTSSPAKEADEEKRDQVSRGGWKQVITARTGKSGSLIVLLCCIGVLYYLTERHRLPDSTPSLYGYNPSAVSSTASSHPSPTVFAPIPPGAELAPPETLWRSINPLGFPMVRISVPPASIIVLPRPGHAIAPADLRKLYVKPTRLLLPRLKPLFYLLKVMILPQAVTAGALWLLLRYLLKDSDLLDAQRNKLGRETAPGRRRGVSFAKGRVNVAEKVSVQMLPASDDCDIEVIASSADGRTVVTIGLNNAVHLWRFNQDSGLRGTRENVILPAELSSATYLTAVMSSNSEWLAIASGGGAINLWHVVQDAQVEDRGRIRREGKGRLREIAFINPAKGSEDPFTAASSARDGSDTPDLLALLRDGSLLQMDASGERTVVPASAKRHVVTLLASNPGTSNTQSVVSDGGEFVDLMRLSRTGWSSIRLHSTRDAQKQDRVTCFKSFPLNREMYGIVHLIGYKSGLVELFDDGGNLILSLHLPNRVTFVDIAVPKSSSCLNCFGGFGDGFWVITGTTMGSTHIHRIHPRSQWAFCRCHSNPASGSGSLKSSPSKGTIPVVIPPTPIRRTSAGKSPRASPSLLSPVSNGEFPLSSHGTRRLSALHKEDNPEVQGVQNVQSLQSTPMRNGQSADEASWTDLEATDFGAMGTDGGAILLGDRIVSLHKSGVGVGDSQWQVNVIDLRQPWDGTTLVADSSNLGVRIRRTLIARSATGNGGMRSKREERILSLSGRKVFGSLSSAGQRTPGNSNSMSLGNPGLAYVQISALAARGEDGLVAGFGNRLGIIDLPKREGESEGMLNQSIGTSSGSSLRPNTSASGSGGRRGWARDPIASSGSPFLIPPPHAPTMGTKKDI